MQILDTNIFIHCDYAAIEGNIAITSGVLAELDAQKDGEYKSQIRQAMRYILSEEIPVLQDSPKLPVDDALIEKAKKCNATVLTNDVAMQIKCQNSQVAFSPVQTVSDKYNGVLYVVLLGDDVRAYQQITADPSECRTNFFGVEPQSYIVFEDEYGELVEVFRWTGRHYARLHNHPELKAWNVEQMCAIDALMIDTPIKIIVGVYGSAKTYLTTTIGYHAVHSKGAFSKLVMIRNADTGVDREETVGYLPGDYEDKIAPLFLPIAQYFPHGAAELVMGITQNTMACYLTSNIKGITLGDSFIIVDEAEDFTIAQLKRVGSRIGVGSSMVFCGDSKQTEGKFKQTSGLEYMIEQLKNNPLVSIVRLNEDVRSEASRIFADL